MTSDIHIRNLIERVFQVTFPLLLVFFSRGCMMRGSRSDRSMEPSQQEQSEILKLKNRALWYARRTIFSRCLIGFFAQSSQVQMTPQEWGEFLFEFSCSRSVGLRLLGIGHDTRTRTKQNIRASSRCVIFCRVLSYVRVLCRVLLARHKRKCDSDGVEEEEEAGDAVIEINCVALEALPKMD